MLISTPKEVLIENNTFESSGAAILLAGDANEWYESGACNDVTIRNNIFMSCCLTSDFQFGEGIISLYPEIPSPNKSLPFHHNVRIEDNVFYCFDFPLLYAKCVKGLNFSKNSIVRSYDYIPRHWRKNLITLELCTKVNIGANQFIGDVLDKSILLVGMDETDLDYTSDFCVK